MEDADTLKAYKKQGVRLEVHIDETKDHGRVEKRTCVALEKTDWFRKE